jgi:hypothetical protein
VKLELLLLPTSDLEGSLNLFRLAFGATELWREGDTTAALSLPGTDVQLMLDANDPNAPVGPIFVVDDVAAFHTTRPETLNVIDNVSEIPGGFMAAYQDAGGVIIYVLDQSTDSAAEES